MRKKRQKNESLLRDIAVIGLSGRFPGANNIAEFWDNLKKGKETISFFSEKELKEEGISALEYKMPNYIKAKGIIENIEGFDADLIIIDLNKKGRINPIKFKSKAKHSAFEGYEFQGLPVMTILNGKIVMDDGEILAKDGMGSIIKPGD